jgi:penicillin-binding protein 2
LLDDGSNPLQNRATQELHAIGSTFKPLGAFIGLGTGMITTTSTIRDLGIFEEVDPAPTCWKYPSNHGVINVSQAIMHSCNYFFYDIGYRIAQKNGLYDDAQGIETLKYYADMFGLTAKSGLEIEESQPTVSNRDIVRSMIGYYHNFAPVHLSRYITAIANGGKVLDFTLIDRIVGTDNELVSSNEPKVSNVIDVFSDAQWSAVRKGMNWVVNTSTNSLSNLYGQLGVTVAGKTGTVQVSKTIPNHALFTSFAPYENPEIAVTVVIPNGYASANAAYLAREVYGLYYNDENKEALLSGDVKAGTATSITISD